MRKTKVFKFVFRALISLALVVGGVIIGKFYNAPGFTVEKEINLVDLSAICVTVFVAWYISDILDKEKLNHRTEKDLIIKRAEDVYQLFDNSIQKVIAGSIPLQEATSQLKRINVSILGIYKILAKINLTTDPTLQTEIFSNTRKLNGFLTLTPVVPLLGVPVPQQPISVANGIITIIPSRINEIQTEYDKLKDNIILLQISINKA